MFDSGFGAVALLPLYLGLFGFIEPCSIGSTLLMVKQMEGQSGRDKIVQMLTFAGTRAIFIGALGAVASGVGAAFLGFQKSAWLILGLLYLALGVVYLSGRAGFLMRGFGPTLNRLRSTRGAAVLGPLFGLNIPACAAPLILALLGFVVADGTSAMNPVAGFLLLATFGLALSLPLVVAVFLRRRALCSTAWRRCRSGCPDGLGRFLSCWAFGPSGSACSCPFRHSDGQRSAFIP